MRSEACGCPKVRFADLQIPAGGPRDLVLRVTMTPRRMRSARDPGGNAGQRRAQARAAKSPRWSAERRAFPDLGNAGRRKHGARVPVMARTTGCSQHPGACRRSAIPSSGWRIEKREASRTQGERKKDNGEEKKRRRKMGRSEIRRVGKGARRTINGLATRSIACAVPTRSALSRGRTAWARRTRPGVW